MISPDHTDIQLVSENVARGAEQVEAWSPDGEWLILSDFRHRNIFRAQLDETGVEQISPPDYRNVFIDFYVSGEN